MKTTQYFNLQCTCIHCIEKCYSLRKIRFVYFQTHAAAEGRRGYTS